MIFKSGPADRGFVRGSIAPVQDKTTEARFGLLDVVLIICIVTVSLIIARLVLAS